MTSKRRDIVREDCRRALAGGTEMLAPLRNSALFVTGGTGFVGTWLTEMIACLNDEHGFNVHVTLMARQCGRFVETAEHLAARKDVTVVLKDVRSVLDLPPETQWIIHAAATPDRRVHASDPVGAVDVIVNGTRAMLVAAVQLSQLRKFLNISSGLIYGTQPWDMPAISESFCGSLDCANVSSGYPEAKRFAETLCAAYQSEHRLIISTVRPFAFIGPYQPLGLPWAGTDFIRDAMLGGPIRVHGDGQTIRSHMYPSDMAYWLLNILVKGRSGQAYNVGSARGVTLAEFAARIADCVPGRPRIEFGVLGERRPPASKRVPDVSLCASALSLGLSTDLDMAIKRTISWNQTT